MYLFHTPSLPSLSPERREAIALLWNRTVQAFLWAVALAYTAGRLTRIGFEWARPHIAKALHALAIALDKALLYPDQPEPDPTPDLAAVDGALHAMHERTGLPFHLLSPSATPGQVDDWFDGSSGPGSTPAADKLAATKPRAARRRTTRAAA